MMRLILPAALALTAFGAAEAQEVRTNPSPEPPVAAAAADDAPVAEIDPNRSEKEAIGAWAQKILDDAASGSSDKAKKTAACPVGEDKKPHGEVWVGAGTGGYQEIGGVVTQPIGDCSELTVGYSQTQYGAGRGRRR